MTSRGTPDLLRELAAVLPAEALVTDADVLEAHRRDQAEWAPAGMPRVLVRPASTAEVQASSASPPPFGC
ncbi:hypothetical protein ACLESD_27770, partial [Pyxidicoccus sp. 3LFB2]